jgi:hypothetical protein
VAASYTLSALFVAAVCIAAAVCGLAIFMVRLAPLPHLIVLPEP